MSRRLSSPGDSRPARSVHDWSQSAGPRARRTDASPARAALASRVNGAAFGATGRASVGAGTTLRRPGARRRRPRARRLRPGVRRPRPRPRADRPPSRRGASAAVGRDHVPTARAPFHIWRIRSPVRPADSAFDAAGGASARTVGRRCGPTPRRARPSPPRTRPAARRAGRNGVASGRRRDARDASASRATALASGAQPLARSSPPGPSGRVEDGTVRLQRHRSMHARAASVRRPDPAGARRSYESEVS
jgi:hypothetical protein